MAWWHYEGLLATMSEMGLRAALDKCAWPSTRMCWIGVIFYSLLMRMKIEPGRIKEAIAWCRDILDMGPIGRHKFQQFMGKLLYAAKCTRRARVFTNRLLEFIANVASCGG